MFSRIADRLFFASRPRRRPGHGFTKGRKLRLEGLEQRQMLSITLGTDQLDYAPGATAYITAAELDLGETVEFQITSDTPGPGQDPWQVTDGSADDLDQALNGAILTSWLVDPDGAYIGSTLVARATALGSGETATAMFSDSVTNVVITTSTLTVTSLPAQITVSFNYSTSVSGTTTGVLDILGTTATQPKVLVSGSDKSDSITLTIPAGTANGTYNAKVTVTNDFGTGANQRNHVMNNLVVINVSGDTTPPVITPNVTGELGDNGWYTSDVTVTWTVTDPESAITLTTGADSTTIDGDTDGVTLTCTATSAGGTSSQSVTIKRDATMPVVTTPGDLTFTYGDLITFDCSASDATSGIDTSSLPSLKDAMLDAGTYTYTASATDKAGNSDSKTFTVTVQKAILEADANVQAALDLAKNGTVMFNLSNVTGIVDGKSVAELLNGAIFTLQMKTADGSGYETKQFLAAATVDAYGAVHVKITMAQASDSDGNADTEEAASLYAFLSQGLDAGETSASRASVESITLSATSNGGNYAISEDVLTRIFSTIKK
jgi:hypothetical protein